jgi:hypothetical protein
MPNNPAEVRASVRGMVVALLRALGTTIALTGVYFLVPLDHTSTGNAVTILVIGLVGLITLVGFQVVWISRSRFPGLRAVEALGVSLPLFLLLFSGTYVVLAAVSTDNFGQALTETDGLYFAVTVFATVGFGDITAKSEVARLVVTGQMVADLIVIGVGAKIILGAVTRGRQRRPQNADPGGRSGG